MFVPRGNGKTTFAAPVALYMTFMDEEGGAEGYAAAVTRDQARIMFDAALNMARGSPEFRKFAHVDTGANAIYQLGSASKLVPISSDAKALDGLNVQVAVCDEIGSHKTPEVYNILLTAMGKRQHPLLLSISTVTGNNTGRRRCWPPMSAARGMRLSWCYPETALPLHSSDAAAGHRLACSTAWFTATPTPPAPKRHLSRL